MPAIFGVARSTTATGYEVAIDIGGMPIRLRTASRPFRRMLEERYAGFVNRSCPEPLFELEVDLVPPGRVAGGGDVRVRQESGRWSIERGDFRAEWEPALRRGWVRQSPNPHSIDSTLRIVHTLLLALEGGFLVHAASAVRDGRAVLFVGPSGAGKTTIARLAPENVTLLTDEISYVRLAKEYRAFGTPFTGELGRPGANSSAPIEALYVLEKDRGNRLEPMRVADGVRALLANILFFAQDPDLVTRVFQSACEFVARVPVYRLGFVPDATVWELIR